MILTPEILSLFILNGIFLFFGFIAFILSFKIFLKWDSNSTTQTQYTLEKQSFLTATIIKYMFIVKLPLFLFFIFTLDKLSTSIIGAMCAAGVVDATPYGTYLFIIKIINIYLFGFWLLFHSIDIALETPKYTKQKFGLFIIAFFFLVTEIILETLMFYSIDISKMVSCCGTLFSSTTASYISTIFLIKTPILLTLFYSTFISLFILYFLRLKHLFSLFNLLFLIISIISLIAFFGTYIYQLPTHHCPFCFLQKDYYYVGYLIYSVLFIGTFYGLSVGFKNNDNLKNYKLSLLFNIFYVIIVSLYPIVYYIQNGVWL
jgi:hypothetical protein